MKTSAIWRAFLFVYKAEILFGFKNPFLVHSETYKNVDHICNDVGEIAGLHKF